MRYFLLCMFLQFIAIKAFSFNYYEQSIAAEYILLREKPSKNNDLSRIYNRLLDDIYACGLDLKNKTMPLCIEGSEWNIISFLQVKNSKDSVNNKSFIILLEEKNKRNAKKLFLELPFSSGFFGGGAYLYGFIAKDSNDIVIDDFVNLKKENKLNKLFRLKSAKYPAKAVRKCIKNREECSQKKNYFPFVINGLKYLLNSYDLQDKKDLKRIKSSLEKLPQFLKALFEELETIDKDDLSYRKYINNFIDLIDIIMSSKKIEEATKSELLTFLNDVVYESEHYEIVYYLNHLKIRDGVINDSVDNILMSELDRIYMSLHVDKASDYYEFLLDDLTKLFDKFDLYPSRKRLTDYLYIYFAKLSEDRKIEKIRKLIPSLEKLLLYDGNFDAVSRAMSNFFNYSFKYFETFEEISYLLDIFKKCDEFKSLEGVNLVLDYIFTVLLKKGIIENGLILETSKKLLVHFNEFGNEDNEVYFINRLKMIIKLDYAEYEIKHIFSDVQFKGREALFAFGYILLNADASQGSVKLITYLLTFLPKFDVYNDSKEGILFLAKLLNGADYYTNEVTRLVSKRIVDKSQHNFFLEKMVNAHYRFNFFYTNKETIDLALVVNDFDETSKEQSLKVIDILKSQGVDELEKIIEKFYKKLSNKNDRDVLEIFFDYLVKFNERFSLILTKILYTSPEFLNDKTSFTAIDGLSNIAEVYNSEELQIVLLKFIDELGPEERSAILLRLVEELKGKDKDKFIFLLVKAMSDISSREDLRDIFYETGQKAKILLIENISYLTKIDTPIILIDLLGDSYIRVRRKSFEVLAANKDVLSGKYLGDLKIILENDQSPWRTRWLVVKLLAKINNPRANKILREHLRNEKDSDVRKEIVKLLKS